MGLYASGTFQSLDALEANPCSHGSLSRLGVGRAIPHAPFVNNQRRAEEIARLPNWIGHRPVATGSWLLRKVALPLPLLLSSGRRYRFRRRGRGRASLAPFARHLRRWCI